MIKVLYSYTGLQYSSTEQGILIAIPEMVEETTLILGKTLAEEQVSYVATWPREEVNAAAKSSA